MTPKPHSSVSKPTFAPTPNVNVNSISTGSDIKPPRYEIAPRRSTIPMSELIRRANSMPGSPFPTPHPSSSITLAGVGWDEWVVGQ
ncbi:hypothetical protein M413DRAFT_351267 [Hebeloma cylindrosporum]|uniref:Uncharacterized protein n=1 Tax=Hebeloma cylindrosporum TaxID=76867 RepID=A0A0C2Y2F5_HEBCY|nr:hypothetical protein M413DRAFT_351267 [Hebeloma cylindrosporum h7]